MVGPDVKWWLQIAMMGRNGPATFSPLFGQTGYAQPRRNRLPQIRMKNRSKTGYEGSRPEARLHRQKSTRDQPCFVKPARSSCSRNRSTVQRPTHEDGGGLVFLRLADDIKGH
jgi:hypothetical protein